MEVFYFLTLLQLFKLKSSLVCYVFGLWVFYCVFFLCFTRISSWIRLIPSSSIINPSIYYSFQHQYSWTPFDILTIYGLFARPGTILSCIQCFLHCCFLLQINTYNWILKLPWVWKWFNFAFILIASLVG